MDFQDLSPEEKAEAWQADLRYLAGGKWLCTEFCVNSLFSVTRSLIGFLPNQF